MPRVLKLKFSLCTYMSIAEGDTSPSLCVLGYVRMGFKLPVLGYVRMGFVCTGIGENGLCVYWTR